MKQGKEIFISIIYYVVNKFKLDFCLCGNGLLFNPPY